MGRVFTRYIFWSYRLGHICLLMGRSEVTVMVKMTQSFSHWCWTYHRDIYTPLMFGHVEELTPELWQEYIEWVKTDEGKKYLKGGECYVEEENKED